MSTSDVKSVQRLGVLIIILLILNFWMLHREEDAVREFDMYFQGVMTGMGLRPSPSKPSSPSPLIQMNYEN